ncbi:hypothetical protein C5167_046881 [Papaver somniferum]|uniref:F-box domain-containing protein n=1 Tax=Papaver somniferum TaxID=3469 RepID=A0A4Y7LF24_PAPSO|nr:F-box protein At2g27310-like [Papaver somniferum]RZC84104.1 hypothetical protein C5167_046881 [Papaver somniferum]
MIDESFFSSSPSSITGLENKSTTTISSVHSDILLNNILTRLDGPTLASTGCASTELYTLSTQQKLWSDICHAVWPSTTHPHICHIVSSFPNGPRSFFSDAFPLLLPSSDPPKLQTSHHHSSQSELISAVDIHYKNEIIYSKVQTTETLSGWFQYSPFRIDLLDPKFVVPTEILFDNDSCRDLAKCLKLSWIVIDPTGRRAANLSSGGAVSVHQHWLTGEIELKFATIMASGGNSDELAESEIIVTCGGSQGGELHVTEVSLKMQDMNGSNLSGKDSLVILKNGMVNGKRVAAKEEAGKGRYEEYLRIKKEREERKLRREGRLDAICIGLGGLVCFGLCMLAWFW